MFKPLDKLTGTEATMLVMAWQNAGRPDIDTFRPRHLCQSDRTALAHPVSHPRPPR